MGKNRSAIAVGCENASVTHHPNRKRCYCGEKILNFLTKPKPAPNTPCDLYDLIQKIQKRPSMHLGKPHISNLRSCLSGYNLARRKLGISPTNHEQEFVEFSNWITKKFNVSTGQSWDNIILFYSEHYITYYRRKETVGAHRRAPLVRLCPLVVAGERLVTRSFTEVLVLNSQKM
jgi:hypothetical protein